MVSVVEAVPAVAVPAGSSAGNAIDAPQQHHSRKPQ